MEERTALEIFPGINNKDYMRKNKVIAKNENVVFILWPQVNKIKNFELSS